MEDGLEPTRVLHEQLIIKRVLADDLNQVHECEFDVERIHRRERSDDLDEFALLFLSKSNEYDVSEELDEDFAASFEEGEGLVWEDHVLDAADDELEFGSGDFLEVGGVVEVLFFEQEGGHG